ncbi:type II toxin-antitoxin system HicA family toxin [Brachybacterium timonense]|uniref:type II toxin-antitoxin system HicA family toxin n=1 Tax=Brachybacterium timonense TaxID=2050896 RepID=UPI000D0B42A4|nr:type II toxin-antitoxin system HicA family toxin [Brachybacterium timonense]
MSKEHPVPPTPRALRGRTDPARRVRPVDWTSRPARPRSPQEEQAQGAASPAGSAEPTATVQHEESQAKSQQENSQQANSQQADSQQAEPAAKHPNARRSRRLRSRSLPSSGGPPPPEAVHVLRPEDPRPLLRPLRIQEELIRTPGPMDLQAQAIVEVVAQPEQEWSSDGGVSDHFLRGTLVVQVRRSDNTVIGVFPTAYALRVRPEEAAHDPDRDLETAGPSARGGRGTRHPTSRRELLTALEKAGFTVASGGTHDRVTHPEHPGLFVPLATTPSDRRFTRHTVAAVRRVFGIDLKR